MKNNENNNEKQVNETYKKSCTKNVKLNVSTEVEMLEKLNMCSWVVLHHYNAVK